MLISKIIVPDALRQIDICITGFSGYIGSHLVKALVANGIRPYLLGRQGMNFNAYPGTKKFPKWNTPEDLAITFSKLKDPVVINLAGHFVAKHEAADIPHLLSGNFAFPISIFEALRISGKKSIVNVGTSWEYSDAGDFGPVNLYGHLKAANAQILDWYASEHEFNIIKLKLNDTYGGADYRPKLMPLLKAHWRKEEKLALRARSQKLNFLYITDVLAGLLVAACHTLQPNNSVGNTFFLIGNETLDMENLIRMINDHVQPKLQVSFDDTSDFNPKLRSVWETPPILPNWAPKISLKEGIRNYFV